MRFLFLAILSIATFTAPGATYHGPIYASPWNTTNAIVANTTNAVAIRLDFPKATNALLSVSFKLTGAGTSPVELIFSPGDDSGYATNSTFVFKWNVTPNGTTGVAGVTNIPLAGIPYLWLISQGHNNANAVTNLMLSYGSKW